MRRWSTFLRLSAPAFGPEGRVQEKSGREHRMRRRAFAFLAASAALGLVAVLALVDAASVLAQDARYIIVQSTTSTENSGLFKHLLPMFTKKTGIEVRVVAVGTGQAIKNAQNGDGDVLFVHDKPSEEKFVAEGWGVKRFDVMYNDFVVVGPAKDPAGIAGCQGRGGGLQEDRRGQGAVRLARRRQRHAQGRAAALEGGRRRRQGRLRHLVSRGRLGHGRDHQHRRRHGRLCVHRPRHLVELQEPRRLKIVVEGDKKLFNQYGVILVNPAKHPKVKKAEGQAFVDWVLSAEGQDAIGRSRSTASSSSSPTPPRRVDTRIACSRRKTGAPTDRADPARAECRRRMG